MLDAAEQSAWLQECAQEGLAATLSVHVQVAQWDDQQRMQLAPSEQPNPAARSAATHGQVRQAWLDEGGVGPLADNGRGYALYCLP